jgi:hypothetical protein
MIMRHLLAVSVVMWTALTGISHVRADDKEVVGRPISGLTIKLSQDGKLSITAGGLIVLDGGRELRHVQGEQYKLVSKEEMMTDPVDMSGIDLLLRGEELVDHRVRVTDGRLYGADVKSALLSVQGGSIRIDLAGADKASVKTLVLNCHSIGTPKDKCGYGVVGTVRPKQYSKGEYELTSVVLEPPKPSS